MTQDPNRWKFGLDRISAALERLGNPQDNFRSVLIGGTNGKGSTCIFLDRILTVCGLRTGVNISPHVSRFTERFHFGGAEISAAEINGIRQELTSRLAGLDLTYFEWCVALSAFIFAEKGADVGIFEIGLGGRLDAANAIDPAVSVITNVTLDHIDYLGDTVEKIAAEKAGIARPGKPLLTAADGGGLKVIRQHARKIGAQLFEARDLVDPGIRLPDHQRDNAKLAVKTAALLGFMPDDCALEYALRTAFLPGRIETVGSGLIMDVAHNIASVLRLVHYLDNRGFDGNAVVGILADKDFAGMLQQLSTRCRRIFAAPVANPRSWTKADIETAGFDNVTCCDTLTTAFDLAGQDGADVLITGSFYTVGELRDRIVCIG